MKGGLNLIKLKKLGILSVGYAGAFITAIVALLQIIMIKVQSLMPLFAQTITDSGMAPALQGMAFVLMLVLTPLMGLVAGFVGGAFLAAIYNLVISPITGGIRIELTESKK